MKQLTHSPEETIELGKKLGSLLPPGTVICLKGNLGAGKTHFSKGVALGLGIDENVTSPTFTIINEYEGKLPLYHIDAYRLEDEEEVENMGFEEYLYDDGIAIIEWPERLEGYLPAEYIMVTIQYAEEKPEVRELEIETVGEKFSAVIEELNKVVHTGD